MLCTNFYSLVVSYQKTREQKSYARIFHAVISIYRKTVKRLKMLLDIVFEVCSTQYNRSHSLT